MVYMDILWCHTREGGGVPMTLFRLAPRKSNISSTNLYGSEHDLTKALLRLAYIFLTLFLVLLFLLFFIAPCKIYYKMIWFLIKCLFIFCDKYVELSYVFKMKFISTTCNFILLVVFSLHIQITRYKYVNL